MHGQCKLALKMSKVMQKLMQIVKMYIVGTWGAHTYVEELCKGQQTTLQLTLAINQIIIIRPTVKRNWLKIFLALHCCYLRACIVNNMGIVFSLRL